MKKRWTNISDKNTWNTALQVLSPYALFQTFEWGEVIEKQHQTLYRFGLYDGKKITGLLQVAVVKSKRGTFLHVRHGPVVSVWNKKIVQSVLSFLFPIAKTHHASFIRLSPLIPDNKKNQKIFRDSHCIPAAIHAMDAERCWVLDINKTDDEILSGMRKTTRYEIKHGQKLGVMVRKSSDLSDVKDFLSLYGKTSKRQGFIEHHGISEEAEIFFSHTKGMVFSASYQGELLASALILFVGNQAIYHHGASIVGKIPASYVLQWEAILEAKKRGMSVYNFWGVAPPNKPNHPWNGLSLFKRGFGGREQTYIHAMDYPLNATYYLFRFTEVIRKLTKGY